MESNIRDAAQSFEGSLMILRKDKNGWVFGFSVHPNEAPSPLLDAPLGTRFQCVMFQIDDDESIMIPQAIDTTILPSVEDLEAHWGMMAVAESGQLCRDPEFRKFIAMKFYQFRPAEEMKINNPIDEAECAEILREAMGVQSRSQLRTNPEARDKFTEIATEYKDRR